MWVQSDQLLLLCGGHRSSATHFAFVDDVEARPLRTSIEAAMTMAMTIAMVLMMRKCLVDFYIMTLVLPALASPALALAFVRV